MEDGEKPAAEAAGETQGVSSGYDAILSELEDAMQSTSAAAPEEDFSEIFGDEADGSGTADQAAVAQFRSAYEKEDFMSWLKDGEEAPADKGRSGSVVSEDFGDIFGDGDAA
eukprot:CAMPEP_0118983644 /NCGR_PEP_ID=MMETSP1173-20130426/35959_1 /TAXON_ID=1034831 /ORGANISM="Rhizochromulina marina cf, Strain CCMP1243" /LENGTH=111 /DNA_ID=CAMNT_0006934241 /DNA_START=36 /DNA_END=368 /DNA_ORIENTATION=-